MVSLILWIVGIEGSIILIRLFNSSFVLPRIVLFYLLYFSTNNTVAFTALSESVSLIDICITYSYGKILKTSSNFENVF
jgi:hypothetical protein